MASATSPRLSEVIDLVSDSDEGDIAAGVEQEDQDVQSDVAADEDLATYHTPPSGNGTPDARLQVVQFDGNDDDDDEPVRPRTQGGTIINIDGEEVFIPDEEPENRQSNAATAATPDVDVAHDQEVAMALDNQAITADECLQRVLDIFPDISHVYVITLYNDFDSESDYEILPGQARLDNIIEQLVSNGSVYPKQEKGKNALKRKRRESTEGDQGKKWEQKDRAIVPHFLKGSMQAVLKAEFPQIPVQFINETLATQKHLYQAFIALAKAKDSNAASNRIYGKGRPSTKFLADANTIATNCGWPELLDELNAARTRVETMRAERTAEEAQKQAENENLQRAIEAGETAECSACFDDLAMNRQIHCNGPVAHFTCFDCAQMYIKSEIGESRCCVLCTAGCGAGFASNQLNLLSDKQLLEKLSQLQQEKDIRDAGLEDLEECPFCDFKAIMPPIDEDFEFRCANPDCEKVSCRRCKSISHIPISCEQHARDNKVNSRHKIEEAMTAALVRSCNKCQRNFIKEYGCNKMTCPSCGNLQCYVCSASLKDYNHFDQQPRGPGVGGVKAGACPLYDNVEERHEREVKEAEAAARAQVVEDNPDVTAEDLEIKVSDAVKKSAADRIRRGGGDGYDEFNRIHQMHHNLAANDHVRAMLRLRDDLDEEDDGDEVLGRVPGDPGVAARRRRHRRMMEHLGRIEAYRREAHERANPQAGAVPHPLPLPAARPPPVVQRMGAPQHIQGYIPVHIVQAPAAAPRPMAPHPAAGGPNQNPHMANGFNQNLFFNQNADPFGRFSGDGAMDRYQAPQQPNAAPPNNNNNLHPVPPFVNPFLNNAPQIHGGVLGPQPGWQGGVAQAHNIVAQDHRGQRQNFQQLEMMRQQHDQQMQQRHTAREPNQALNDQFARLQQLNRQRLRNGHQRPQ